MRFNLSLAGASLAAALLISAVPASAQPILGGPWSGLYVGGNIGAAFDPNKLSFSDQSTAQDLSFNSQDDGTRLIGGLHLGYNFQPGGVLFGVEADTDWAKNVDYLSSIRGRVGVPVGPALLYGTAGAAFEGTHESFDVTSAAGGVSAFSRDLKKSGWTVGGGVETFVMPAVSIGAEGLYYHFGQDTANLATPAAAGAETFAVKDDRNFAVLRARLTYHFGF